MKPTPGGICWQTDPGHGWLQIPKETFKELKINPVEVSGCSYHNSAYVFLEEDCDAELAINAFRAAGVTDDALRRIPTYYLENTFVRRCKHWEGVL